MRDAAAPGARARQLVALMLALLLAAPSAWAGGREEAEAGLAAQQGGDAPAAIAAYARALKAGDLSPRDQAAILNNRANAYKDMRRYAEAMRDYDLAIRLDPGYAPAFNNRGIALGEQGQYARAIADLDHAIMLDPDYANAFNSRGNLYHQMGQHDRAIADLDRAAALDPGLPHLYNNRGIAYAGKGDHDRAIHDYDRAIALAPDDADVFNNRGNAYRAKGAQERALADYDAAIRLNPKQPIFLVNRALTHRMRGEHALAILDYDRAVALDSIDGGTLANRAFDEFFVGLFAEAARDWQRSLALTGPLPYSVLWLHLARLRGSQEDQAEFARNAAALDLAQWPGPVLAYFLARMNESELAAAAGEAAGCGVAFYLGEAALDRRDTSRARQFFAAASSSCDPTTVELIGARAELQRLVPAQAGIR